MPLPKPNKGESKDKFISRCMGSSTMNSEFPDQKQRAAVCYSQWKGKKKSVIKAILLRAAEKIRLLGKD